MLYLLQDTAFFLYKLKAIRKTFLHRIATADTILVPRLISVRKEYIFHLFIALKLMKRRYVGIFAIGMATVLINPRALNSVA